MNWETDWAHNKTKYVPKVKLTWTEFIDTLPQILPDPLNIFAIGGLTSHGWTENDIDLMLPGDGDLQYAGPLKQMVKELFDKTAHVGDHVWVQLSPEPIPIQIYVAGELLDRTTLKALVPELDDKIVKKRTDLVALEDRVARLEER